VADPSYDSITCGFCGQALQFYDLQTRKTDGERLRTLAYGHWLLCKPAKPKQTIEPIKTAAPALSVIDRLMAARSARLLAK
jgi:hypothetical protein